MTRQGLQLQIDTSGLERVIRNAEKEADRALREVAEEMVSDIKLSFNTGPDGRTYQRGGKRHVASSPGHPPNVDTGTLRASIRWRKISNLTYWIVDGVNYGVALEFGTSKIAARPFFMPVFMGWQGKATLHIRERLNGI